MPESWLERKLERIARDADARLDELRRLSLEREEHNEEWRLLMWRAGRAPLPENIPWWRSF